MARANLADQFHQRLATHLEAYPDLNLDAQVNIMVAAAGRGDAVLVAEVIVTTPSPIVGEGAIFTALHSSTTLTDHEMRAMAQQCAATLRQTRSDVLMQAAAGRRG